MNADGGKAPRGLIAIVGMSGRFPGARSIEQFWENLRDGVESRVEYTDQELAEAGVSVKLGHPRHIKAGFPLDDYDMFDSAFFGINPREAEILDPQHRLFLESAWHALEDAGYDSERFGGTIGIFGGSTWSSYLVANLFRSARLLKSVGYRQLIHGSVPDYMVTRAAYRLNLKGPACFVQTACSTSLVAVHLGCHSLRRGETDMVLAGGVSVAVPHRIGYIHEEGGMESPDGRIRAFDARARGTVFGSGVALVVLRRLEDALRDGDRIHAVIRGTAVNNDGALKVGFTAPGIAGQSEVISLALDDAGVTADEIDYVETHGTGTELGDPIELAALSRAYAAQTVRRGYCAVGSVKPNIGHLDAAAGVSSLIKTVLSLQHGRQPPSINFETLNPKIEIEDTPFFINTTLRDWPVTNGRPRRAAVSSFGFGGTNAHLVLEQAPALPPAAPSRPQQLLMLSARTAPALEGGAAALARHLTNHPEIDLADAAFTLRHGRRPFAFRRAIVASSREQAIGLLQGESSRFLSNGQAAGERRIVFLFPGQGSQYVNMARGMYESEPVFRETVDDCARRLVPFLGCDLREVLYPAPGGEDEASGRLTRTMFTQAAVFTIEYALATLWKHWGIAPDAMVGHSIGEFVAACLAGVMDLDDGLKLVALRGRLMESMPEGAMLAVPQPEAKVRGWLGDDLWLAASNSPALCVVAGTHAAVQALERRLADAGIEARRLHTSHAFHSGLMDGAVAPFVDAVRSVPLSAPSVPYLSNVTGDWATGALVTDPAYWGRHIRDAVRFGDNVAALFDGRESVFVEVGPGTALGTFVRQQARSGEVPRIVASMRHPQEAVDDLAVTLAALGRLWTMGVRVDWSRYAEDESRRRVPLPGYAFERTRHWVEADKVDARHARRARALVEHEDLADWFYVPSWKRTAGPGATADFRAIAESWVILADRRGAGDALASRLRAGGVGVTIVRAGSGWAEDGSTYTIDPTAAAEHRALVARLFKSEIRPGAIVDLWPLDDEPVSGASVPDRGFYDLLYQAQALGAAGVATPLSLFVVTSGVCDVTGAERIDPRKALVLGPARVIPLEFPTIAARQIDVPDGVDPSDLAELLLPELGMRALDRDVAYRGGRRWVETFEPARLESLGGGLPRRLREGGTYLITGGFGGIGLVLAEHLVRKARCNVVLTGRRRLPPRESWAAYLADAPDAGVCRAIRAVQELESLGGRVLPADADVTDEARMREVVEEARTRFGRIDGVVHAAGVAGGGVIQLKTVEMAERVLAPKVQGTEILGRIFAKQSPDFLLLCSSLTSVLGGVGQVDYCAANAYLDAFARSYMASTGIYTLSVNWTAWKQVGMAVDTDMPASARSTLRDRMLAVGITNREGADAFERMLSGGAETQVAVSPVDVQLMLESLHDGTERDAAGAGGSSEVQAAGGHARPDVSSAFVEPTTDIQRQLCGIWREMLGVAEIGVDDSFFELGGHSLLGVRTMARINEVLGSEIPVAKLYEGLTVRFLAQLVERRGREEPDAPEEQDARERRREKARRQKEHQQRRLAAAKR